jgi:DNA polymerase III epsilon subunit-like protein
MKGILDRSDLRIAVIDFEASALAPDSYPIEVGVALIQAVGKPILSWSKLIRPTKKWRSDGRWSPASAGVHGISLEAIEQQGHPVELVCDWLNSLLGASTIVASDAPRYDQDWLDTLFRAADREQLFTLYDFGMLMGGLNLDQIRHLSYLLKRDQPPHRAGPDALRLASKLMEAHLGYPPRTELLEHPPAQL